MAATRRDGTTDMRRHACRALLFISLISLQTAAVPASAAEQAFPSRPIRLVVAFAPGGIADTVARVVSARLKERLGQPVVVENRAGAGGMLGAKVVAAAVPDGHTLLVTTPAIAVNAGAAEGLNPATQLTPVAVAASTPTILTVGGSVTATDLMDYVRNTKHGRFNYSSAGIGTTQHITAEYLFGSVPGLEATHVPFQGGSPVNLAVVSGEVDMGSTTLPTALAFVKDRSMRVLAVVSRTRMALLPDVPTVAESGFPEFEDRSWIAFFAPPNTPQDLARLLNVEIDRAVRLPDVQERLNAIGLDPESMSQADFADYIKREMAKWARVLEATGIKPN
jgi:tripartite-type tricarboxylate transporter receptor subunit TctC